MPAWRPRRYVAAGEAHQPIAATAICGGDGMTIEQQQKEFIESLDGDLTPEQAAQLLEMGDGDTGATPPEEEAEPEASPETEDETDNSEANEPEETDEDQDKPEEIDESQLTAENTVILTKDGKHTIEFGKYQEWRTRAQKAEETLARLADAEAELARLQDEASAKADAGIAPTKKDLLVAQATKAIEQGASIELFGDFSEEALVNGIDQVVDVKLDAKLEAKLAERLAPLEQRYQQEATKAHIDAIYAAHPDADSIVESKELSDWIGTKPDFAQQQYWAVLEKGNTRSVIALFDEFKKATDATQQATPPPQETAKLRAAAKKAIEAAPKPVPSSLSDIPGGRPAGQSRFDQMAEMTDSVELLEHMNALSPEQRQQYVDRYL